MSASTSFSLKLKTKDRNVELKDEINLETNLSELEEIISKTVNIPSSNLKVLFGYPRRMLNFSQSSNIKQAGIKPGDTLFVEESHNKKSPGNIVSDQLDTGDERAVPQNKKSHISETMPEKVKGIFLKKEVPSDNSCLFTSLGFVLSGK